MHYDDADMRALWKQTQQDGEAVLAYLTDRPDHEATTTVIVAGSIIRGGSPDTGTVIPGSMTVEHGFPQVRVMFDDGSEFGFHAARIAPYTPIRYADDGTVLCAVCHA